MDVLPIQKLKRNKKLFTKLYQHWAHHQSNVLRFEPSADKATSFVIVSTIATPDVIHDRKDVYNYHSFRHRYNATLWAATMKQSWSMNSSILTRNPAENHQNDLLCQAQGIFVHTKFFFLQKGHKQSPFFFWQNNIQYETNAQSDSNAFKWSTESGVMELCDWLIRR